MGTPMGSRAAHTKAEGSVMSLCRCGFLASLLIQRSSNTRRGKQHREAIKSKELQDPRAPYQGHLVRCRNNKASAALFSPRPCSSLFERGCWHVAPPPSSASRTAGTYRPSNPVANKQQARLCSRHQLVAFSAGATESFVFTTHDTPIGAPVPHGHIGKCTAGRMDTFANRTK